MQIDDAREFIKFLHGAVPWNGTWFGEYAPGERGAYWWRKHLDEAIAALIAAPSAPAEWVLVPREPTEAMAAASIEAVNALEGYEGSRLASWRAMLDAAPAAPQQAEPVGYFVNDESDDQWHQVDYEQRNGADTYPLYLHPPADEVQQAEPAGEVARIGCHYAMLPDHVCNKCGRIHGYSHPHAAYLRGVDEGKRQAAAPQQAEPVEQIGWSDEFGNLFPMGAWKPAQRTHHDSHKTAWRAVYLHAPAAEVQMLRAAARDVCEWADAAQWALGNETGVPAAKLDALRRVLEGGE